VFSNTLGYVSREELKRFFLNLDMRLLLKDVSVDYRLVDNLMIYCIIKERLGGYGGGGVVMLQRKITLCLLYIQKREGVIRNRKCFLRVMQ